MITKKDIERLEEDIGWIKEAKLGLSYFTDHEYPEACAVEGYDFHDELIDLITVLNIVGDKAYDIRVSYVCILTARQLKNFIKDERYPPATIDTFIDMLLVLQVSLNTLWERFLYEITLAEKVGNSENSTEEEL